MFTALYKYVQQRKSGYSHYAAWRMSGLYQHETTLGLISLFSLYILSGAIDAYLK